MTVSSYPSPNVSDAPSCSVEHSKPTSAAHDGVLQANAGQSIFSVLATNNPGPSPTEDDHTTSNAENTLFHFGLNGSILKSIEVYQSLNGFQPELKSQLNSVSG